MPEVLELAQLLQHDRVAEVDVGRRRVEAELDAQRPALRAAELALQRARRAAQSTALRVRKAASPAGSAIAAPMLDSTRRRGLRRRVAARASGRRTVAAAAAPPHERRRAPSITPLIAVASRRRRRRPAAAARQEAAAAADPRRRSALLALVSTVFGMMMAVASDLPDLENRAEFQRRAELGRCYDVARPAARRPDRQPEPRSSIAYDEISPIMQQRGHRDRGPALLPEPRRRPARHRPRASSRTSSSRSAVQGGSTITQQFVKNALAGAGQPHRLPEAARGGAGLPPRRASGRRRRSSPST